MPNDEIGRTDMISVEMGKGYEETKRLHGMVQATLFDQFGNVKDRREPIPNLVTVLGEYMCAAQLLTTPGIVTPGWMELGTGSGQTSASTILAAYISGSRTALSSKTRSNAVVSMVCTFGAGVGTGAVTEAGVFNVVTQNTTDLLLYSSFSVINKGGGDSLTLTWTLTFS